LAQDPLAAFATAENTVQVLVRDNDINAALRVFKKKMQREAAFCEMKAGRARRRKPSVALARRAYGTGRVLTARSLAAKQTPCAVPAAPFLFS